MIDRDDLKAAVGAGIVSEAQAASLAGLANQRHGARSDLDVGDEPFELFKGFNEIFIMVGLLILAMGWLVLSASPMHPRFQTRSSPPFFTVGSGPQSSGRCRSTSFAVAVWLALQLPCRSSLRATQRWH